MAYHGPVNVPDKPYDLPAQNMVKICQISFGRSHQSLNGIIQKLIFVKMYLLSFDTHTLDTQHYMCLCTNLPVFKLFLGHVALLLCIAG